MSYEVITTKQADDDLRGIYEYIAFELFKAYEKAPWRSRGLRVMPVDNYLVFYIPDKDTGIVTVIRVVYSGRDVEAELSKNLKDVLNSTE